MAEEAKERAPNEWRGSPLQMGGGLDPYGIKEIVVEFDNGEMDVFEPRRREEFGSYELHQMAVYVKTLARDLRKDPKRVA
jgi:hypothetical protein